ncbi:MAG: AMIN domain-containing protein [Gemmatimonadetes bacterium]|nr:AMIN domain-containing protein [Gemmatimonadota bacterium]NNM05838.1 AMIN domain-containing protein [Gemmatimonadota bacterium]
MPSILSLLVGVLLGSGGPVTGLAVQPAPDQTEVIISMEGQAEFRDFTMEGPSRLIVDVLGAEHALPGENFLGIDRGGVRSIRTSQYSDQIVRVVIELDAVVGYRVLQGEGGLRVVMENSGGAFPPWATEPAAPQQQLGETVSSGVSPTASAPQEADRITVNFYQASVEDVLFQFAEFSGRSIVPGTGVDAVISAGIRDQPWDQALEEILRAYGYAAVETESGIIRVEDLETLKLRETNEPVYTRAYTVNYSTAAEIEQAVGAFITPERGRIAINPSTNTVIVTDVTRVLESVGDLISELDRETPQVSISAKIMFVNRTDLNEFGVTYDLKDSEGNQLNTLTPGAIDSDGDGVLELPGEQVDVGTDVISLGGSSIAALGNAKSKLPAPSLTLLTSLVVGRHTLINFIEALESMNMTTVEAEPSVTVMDNQTARLGVGEETPIRVVDAQAGAGGQAGGFPTAQVETRETGIILDATPHVTESGKITLQLRAERSAAVLAESDAGFIFQQQYAESRVIVEDGETVVIGGLTVSETTEVRAGIPLLMDVPLIGRLFRVTREEKIQRDLIILVTPTIVRGGQN